MSKKIKKILISIFLFLIIIFLTLGLIIFSRINKEIDLSLIRTGATSVTRIYYFDYQDRKNRVGEAIELEDEELFLQKSEWSSYYSMPKNLINAFVAIEDRRFYEHNGVDWIRTGKAILNYIFKFDDNKFGGSTITQQLVKNLTGENESTPKRKLEEILRALNLERRLGKNEIIELYLNVVYLSQNCYGVATASKLYFNKDVSELTLLECASLASIVKSPTKYDPYLHIENNLERSKIVLKEMLNQNLITEEEYDFAIADDLVISNNVEEKSNVGIYSWYTEALIDEIASDLSVKYDISKESGRKMLLKGGLNIYSVINPELQEHAEKIFEGYSAYVLPNSNGKYPESACVIIDPTTSDILAIVGGTGKKEANMIFNRATSAKRPPGSSLKPLSVYTPALEEGIINYATVYDDTPLVRENGELWPKNSPNKYRGLTPIYFAVEHSINTIAVKTLRDLSIEKSMKYLDKLNISYDSEKDKNDSSLALGQLTNGETLLSLTNAYCAFANGGYHSTPKTYLYVTDNYGNIILNNEESRKEVFSSETSYIMTKMLENVVNYGTASSIKLSERVSVAGKTGTSSNNYDKWFIGYTPEYVCGVWTGFDKPESMYYSINPSCIIFDEVMSVLYEGNSYITDFNAPINVIQKEFCYDSGKLISDDCNYDIRGERRVLGYFDRKNIPNEECNLHKTVYISTEDGLLSKKFTSFWKKRRVSLLNYERKNISGITVLDNDYLLVNRKRTN